MDLVVPQYSLVEANVAADLEAFEALGAAVCFAAVVVAVVPGEAVGGRAAFLCGGDA